MKVWSEHGKVVIQILMVVYCCPLHRSCFCQYHWNYRMTKGIWGTSIFGSSCTLGNPVKPGAVALILVLGKPQYICRPFCSCPYLNGWDSGHRGHEYQWLLAAHRSKMCHATNMESTLIMVPHEWLDQQGLLGHSFITSSAHLITSPSMVNYCLDKEAAATDVSCIDSPERRYKAT